MDVRSELCVSHPCRVVKVGGSLLECPGLWRTLTRWLDEQPALSSLLIVGGGALADQVRQLDRRYGLREDVAHSLAIRAMHVNGFVLSQLVPDSGWMAGYHQWIQHPTMTGRDRWFFAVEPFLRHEEPELPGVRLPCGWHVTSDSIAARVAAVCQAQELVLLKSTLPAAPGSSVPVAHAASVHLVDDFFPACAGSLPQIRAVNLRDTEFGEIRLSNDAAQ